ncbi:MAG: ABC transporter permease [Armatimonadota bacterium]|nr:ABC transporter permease [Armatimonadota bacterium]MDR7421049.1 ABC transporter permease [Armatimonadota bacterium]MDR7453608.1 ABC transporter permease [Armatimonadota bacterium]MDR7456840.1 ABC transporter permease [Armatimonadota bacterium]MDR7495507.1 ABC transporter permease [Armatimonadota bacterium]
MWRRHLLIAPVVLFLIVLLIVPYVNMVRMSFLVKPPGERYLNVFTLDNYARVLRDGFYWRILANTVWYAVLTTALTLLLGYPLAYAIARAPNRRRPLLLMLLIAPLLVGVVIRAYGWLILLGRVGLVNQLLRYAGRQPVELMYNVTGMTIGLVHVFMPFMALSIAGALQNISPDVERAARSLGASPWKTFWRVTWPLSLPGVFAGMLLVFVLAVSSYVIPILLGGNNVLVIPMLVVQLLLDAFNWPVGSALAMVFFGLTAVVLWGYVKLMNRALRWSLR